ncbi:hypothetical protein ATK30_8997 [Amycolatopsis echigonensis]|uniref:Uncharacterized protein n=1 Tax=Amycolatopsis echigonensis TaxID=2576905 RepID=A0A2N3WVV0_9PSEU|nr:hypothetical protein ATK30_8997 [Amycolatopsis niigatensis]
MTAPGTTTDSPGRNRAVHKGLLDSAGSGSGGTSRRRSPFRQVGKSQP